MMEDLKSFVLNSGLLTPAQKAAALQMSVPEMMNMYGNLVCAQMEPKTSSTANSNPENPPTTHNWVSNINWNSDGCIHMLSEMSIIYRKFFQLGWYEKLRYVQKEEDDDDRYLFSRKIGNFI